MAAKTCTIIDCTNAVNAQGLCRTHYSRFRLHGDPQAHIPVKQKQEQPATCKTGCGRKPLAKGLCAAHYMRLRKTGEVGPAEFSWHPTDPEATEKACSKCKEVKPLEEFYKAPRIRDGRASECKSCFGVGQRDRTLRRKYGMSAADYDAMHAAQGGVCAICEEPRKLVIDHCHRGGQVRALLCDRCNRVIGAADDNIDLMARAIEFLKKHVREEGPVAQHESQEVS